MPRALPVALISLLAVGACVAPSRPRPAAAPAAEPVAAPAPELDLDSRDLKRLVRWMIGSFSNVMQAEADPQQYVEARVEIVRIWHGREDGFWLYAEHAVDIDPDRPYQQRVYRATAWTDGTLRLEPYEFPPGEALRHAGAWRSFDPLADLAPEDLVARPDCPILLRPEDDRMFVGATEGDGCASQREGAAYATTQLMVRDDMVVIWDRGFDATGLQVWGPQHGGYLFNRRTEEAELVETPPPPPPPTAPAPPTPEDVAGEYSAANGGRAMVVRRGGEVVFERYDDGFDADRPHRLASGTASFWGVLAVAAAEDGILTLDEPVCDTITEWIFDEHKSGITVRQLLSCTSGLDPGLRGPEEPVIPDRFLYALSLEAPHPPGEAFTYGPSHLEVFGELLYRKLLERGETPVDYLRRRVLDPVGVDVARWRADEAGNPHMFYGAYMTARAWARFGQLVCDGGVWNDAPVVDADGLAECFRGSGPNRWYGLTFWLGVGDSAPAGLPDDLIRATGSGHQRLYIVPSRQLVVVRLGESGNFNDIDFLSILLGLNK
ncbi:MAG: CpcT/CpeT family chromophore lyase [Planctomycetota bacterium]|jgi:CubicO group peptidase (beta-lactamase class C family)